MRQLLKSAAAVLVAGAVAASPVYAASPEGEWESGPRDQRYQIKLCGDGDDLCGWLIFSSDKSAEAQKLVNTMVLDTAVNIAPSTWKGSMTLSGYQLSGTIRLIDANTLRINACALFVICGEFNLYRA